jgi:hypothetical protein
VPAGADVNRARRCVSSKIHRGRRRWKLAEPKSIINVFGFFEAAGELKNFLSPGGIFKFLLSVLFPFVDCMKMGGQNLSNLITKINEMESFSNAKITP